MARKSGTKGTRQRTRSQKQRTRSQRQGQRQRSQRQQRQRSQRSQRKQRTRQGGIKKRRTQKRSLNPFMQKLNAARTSGAQSFQYNGNSYKLKKTDNILDIISKEKIIEFI